MPRLIGLSLLLALLVIAVVEPAFAQDAESGEVQWVHPIDRPVWGSPLAADGKVYLGTGRETLWVFRAGRELEVLERIRMHDAIHTTPTAANGTLFIATGRHLYAVDGVE